MKTLLVFAAISFLSVLNAQCISGNCTDGNGKFNFGYAVYEGSFQKGKPHGFGKMDFGNGEFYEGGFTEGKENGAGILYKKGIAKNVKYKMGKLENELVVVGGNAPHVEGCTKGDCTNGYSEISFTTGNSYAGEFKNGVKHGHGKFQFASGNYFEGNFIDNYPTYGIFYYAAVRVTFEGSVDKDGIPESGLYSYGNGATVTIENGKITKIYNPEAERIKAEIAAYNEVPKPVQCPVCEGDGIAGYSRATYSYTHENFGTDRYLYGQYQTNTRSGELFPNICTNCGGKGMIDPS